MNGGIPQGSILGVFLFNVSVDNLEDGSGCAEDAEDVDAPRLGHHGASGALAMVTDQSVRTSP